MNEQEKALAALPPTARKVFSLIERYGPLSAPDLRVDGRVARDHPDEWKGGHGGLTDSLRPLLATGLIRKTGKRTRSRARIYEATAADQVAAQAMRHRRYHKPPRKSSGSTRSSINAEIAQAKRDEKEAGTTARAHVIGARKAVLELTLRLMQMKPMVYWKCTRDDEIANVYEAAVRLEDWAKQVQAACDWDRTSAEMRERIRMLRNTNGRGLEEAEMFRRKADELEEELEAAED
jgi:DNA-binding PadR family transcriptional regulator